LSGEGARGEKGPGVGHPSAALRGRACGTTMSALRGPFQMREQPAHEAGFVFAGELVFPKTEDAPAERAEGAGDEAVAGAVGGKLWLLAPSGRPQAATPALRCGATRDV